MKRITWKKHHLWFSAGITFFMIMFCVSGVILNHRKQVADIGVSRKLLPDSYRFKKWNGGLLRGTLRYCDSDSLENVLVYGNSGIWKTDALGKSFTDFNDGLPSGPDYRNIRGCVLSLDGSLWAAGQFGLYRYDIDNSKWKEVSLPLYDDEKISDITIGGDTLVVVARSHIYISVPPYNDFTAQEIKAPLGSDGKVSLFRTVWLLHSGEIFGITGRLIMDIVAVVLIFLSVSGIIYWLLPKYIKRAKRVGKSATVSIKFLKFNLNWHDRIGRYTFIILIFIVFTGWCLRPPLLIAIASARVSPIPYTVMDSDNAWADKLRMLRYDSHQKDWILSSSDGMFSLTTLSSTPIKIDNTPPVSVMGMNVWKQQSDDMWVVGSFSGMYLWNRKHGVSYDYFTHEIAEDVSGPPFGKFAVSGYSDDINSVPLVCDYNNGVEGFSMPESLAYLPMPLWNLAQEVHTGRIYTFMGAGTLIFIFFAGAIALWSIISGYVIRKKLRD